MKFTITLVVTHFATDTTPTFSANRSLLSLHLPRCASSLHVGAEHFTFGLAHPITPSLADEERLVRRDIPDDHTLVHMELNHPNHVRGDKRWDFVPLHLRYPLHPVVHSGEPSRNTDDTDNEVVRKETPIHFRLSCPGHGRKSVVSLLPELSGFDCSA